MNNFLQELFQRARNASGTNGNGRRSQQAAPPPADGTGPPPAPPAPVEPSDTSSTTHPPPAAEQQPVFTTRVEFFLPAELFGMLFAGGLPGGSIGGAGEAFAQAMHDSFVASQPQGPPPASPSAVAQLPIIVVSPEDIVEVCNRECCVCLEPNELESKVVRLPCAHLFHIACIRTWLATSNSCPVCRYELPTNDAQYEVGRRQRMRARKPRFARHELDRLSIRQLQSLLVDEYRAVDKADLITHLMESHAVELIAAPEPVSYRLADLQAMSISQLKSAMEEAGVFYYKRDVVEKDDLLRVFVMSGRLNVLPDEPVSEEEEQQALSSSSSGPLVETVEDHSTIPAPTDDRADTSLLIEENLDYRPEQERAGVTTGEEVPAATEGTSVHAAPVASETGEVSEEKKDVDDDDDNDTKPAAVGKSASLAEADTSDETMPAATEDNINPVVECATAGALDEEMPPADAVPAIPTPADSGSNVFSRESSVGFIDDDLNEMELDGPSKRQRTGRSSFANASCASSAVDESLEDDQDQMEADPPSGRATPMCGDYSAAVSDTTERFADLSISQLRSLARELSVDVASCIERQEIIGRIIKASGDPPARRTEHSMSTISNVSGDDNNATASTKNVTTPYDEWAVCELRSVAGLVDVDLSHCSSRQEMAVALNQAAQERPHAGQYLRALEPLARLTVPQLRAVAREKQVDVTGCLEKGDIIRRLVGAYAE